MILNPPCWGPAGILTMGFGSVSCWEPGRSPGVAGAGWHRAPLRGGGIYHPAAAAGSAPGLFSLSLAHRSSATGFHGLHTTNMLTHMLACAQTHVWTRTHMGTSPCAPAAMCAPRSRAHAQISRAWQHFARWHAILLLHVCTRRRSPKCAHTRRCARTNVPVSPQPRARRASPCPRSALCSPEPALPSCAQILEQLLAAAGASRPRRPLAWGPECHVSPCRSEPPRPPQAPRRLLHGARWEPPSASSPQAVHGEGALRGGPQLQLCC